ncbi:hypothetical protein [Arsenophonus nasoniae]|uniref:hypothetical protein n=1 Tax=Arsenophonus nasoniae TaxID=638 RepID=UPI0038791CFE
MAHRRQSGVLYSDHRKSYSLRTPPCLVTYPFWSNDQLPFFLKKAKPRITGLKEI